MLLYPERGTIAQLYHDRDTFEFSKDLVTKNQSPCLVKWKSRNITTRVVLCNSNLQVTWDCRRFDFDLHVIVQVVGLSLAHHKWYRLNRRYKTVALFQTVEMNRKKEGNRQRQQKKWATLTKKTILWKDEEKLLGNGSASRCLDLRSPNYHRHRDCPFPSKSSAEGEGCENEP